MEVRPAQAGDAAAIAEIYAHHVAHGTASFDYESPEADFWRAKIASLGTMGWPFLVAEIAGEVAGYAYAAQIRERPGYRFTCEDSIYVRADMVKRGIGTTLLGALIEAARDQGFRQMIAVIGGGDASSVAVHAKLGFREVGRLQGVGFKHGKVLDSVYMQRGLC